MMGNVYAAPEQIPMLGGQAERQGVLFVARVMDGWTQVDPAQGSTSAAT
jgi:hypothetical protein